jgi:hypothetical protein
MKTVDKRWIVVIRKVRHHETERGLIVSNLMSEASAREEARELLSRESMSEYNVWAMPEEDY